MLDNNNDIYNETYRIEDNDIIKRKIKNKKFKRFLNYKFRLYLLGIFLSWLTIILIFFNNDNNNIRKVIVTNNTYLKDEYIIKLSELTSEDKYNIFDKNKIEDNILESPYIKDIKVIYEDYNIINLEIIEESLVAYQFNDEPVILTKDGNSIKIEKEFEYLISYYPILFGDYTDDILKKICDGLNKLESSVIENISEIEPFETTYDPNMLRILMRDNRFIFTSTLSLEPINYYYDIVKELEEDEVCLYVIEISNHMYSSICPWEKDYEDKLKQEQEKQEEQEENKDE